jgi:hypothetical protein
VDTTRDLQAIIAPTEGYDGVFQAAAPMNLRASSAPMRSSPVVFLTDAPARQTAPDDFQLIGFDNTPQTAQYSYQLTTLHQDVAAISRQA